MAAQHILPTLGFGPGDTGLVGFSYERDYDSDGDGEF